MISGANGTSAYSYINYDFRSLNGGKNDNNYYLNFTIGDATLSSGCTAADAEANTSTHCTESRHATGLIGQALINDPSDKLQGFGPLTGTDSLRVNVELNAIDSNTALDALTAGTAFVALATVEAPLQLAFVWIRFGFGRVWGSKTVQIWFGPRLVSVWS